MIPRDRLHRASILAWLAVIALVLVPTLSRLLPHDVATAHRGHGSAVEVCSAEGTRAVVATAVALSAADAATPADAPPEPAAPAHLGHLDHCPLCGLGGAQPLLPPTAFAWLPPAASARARPPLFSAAPRPLHAWAAARPRGPPALA